MRRLKIITNLKSNWKFDINTGFVMPKTVNFLSIIDKNLLAYNETKIIVLIPTNRICAQVQKTVRVKTFSRMYFQSFCKDKNFEVVFEMPELGCFSCCSQKGTDDFNT